MWYTSTLATILVELVDEVDGFDVANIGIVSLEGDG